MLASVMFSNSNRLISTTLRRLRHRPVASGKGRSRTVVQACFGSDLYGVGMSEGPRDLADGFGIEHAALYTISSAGSQSADTPCPAGRACRTSRSKLATSRNRDWEMTA